MEYLVRTEYPSTLNIHLNRPRSLNSLNTDVVMAIKETLRGCLKTVVFTGEGRAFCAGGDILEISVGGKSPNDFFYKEFNLFYDISNMPQNRIAVLDGITMGGGVGLSMACSHRILTQKTMWMLKKVRKCLTSSTVSLKSTTHYLHGGNICFISPFSGVFCT